MRVSFQISSKSMNGDKDAGKKILLYGKRFDNVSSDGRYFIHKVSVILEEGPEALIYSESNVLPFSFGKRIELSFNPDVSGFFTARRAEF